MPVDPVASVRGMSLYAKYTDGELVALCLEGDHLAWEMLIFRYRKLMYSIPLEYGFDDGECQDVVQNVWIALLNRLHSLRDRAKVYSWLMTTAKRECHTHWAKKQQAVVKRNIEEPLDPAGSLEEVLLWTEKQQVLREILEKWPDPCSQLIKALYFEERNYEETAERLGVSPEGIGPRRLRCIGRLREMLSRRGITNLG
jgi:RNA polymerase sigma factor (sigma-70 family)